MKTHPFLALVLALSLLPGTAAFAQGHERQHQRDRYEQSQRGYPGQGRADADRWNQNRERGYRERAYDQQRERAYREEGRSRGAGPNHNLHRGDRLDSQYRHHNYVVDDWRGHRLSPPPRGYHWVQTGGDYVLVAIATGVIMQILLSH